MSEDKPDRMARLADLMYEAAMLKHTPRSGFAFLGSGAESVAEHSFGAAFAGFLLAKMAGADIGKTVLMCLFHDLHEAATGDFNYVNHRYDKCDSEKALRDSLAGSGMTGAIMELWREFERKESREARLAHDADQIDMISALRREQAIGNPNAAKWLVSAVRRIGTEEGAALCEELMRTDPDHWWYDQVDISWWIDHGKKYGSD